MQEICVEKPALIGLRGNDIRLITDPQDDLKSGD